MEKDGEVLLAGRTAPRRADPACRSDKPAMTLREIVDFALQAPQPRSISFREAASMNQALADEGCRAMACASARS